MRPTERLQRVRRHIRQAEQIVEQQATVVAALKLHGNNSDDARNLLGACTEELGRHRADLERLLVGPDVAPQAGENAMLKGWRVKFIHGDHLHIFLVGISDKDAAKSVAVGDRTGVSRITMEEIDDVEKFGLLEGQMMEGHGSPESQGA